MRIKYIIYYFALLCCLLSSCTTSQKITINGIPGTEIYTPDMRKLGMVESNGKLKTTSKRGILCISHVTPNW